MSEAGETSSRDRGRGRGKSRGGLGKYLRARGRGRGSGRPAEFMKRLVLEEEEVEEDEEEIAARQAKYSRRHLGSNADRYTELEPEVDSDGEPILEPEVDLSAFLEKQKLADNLGPSAPAQNDADDVDHSLDDLVAKKTDLKGKTQQIEWDDTLEDLWHEKASAEATRDLKNRFRAKSDRLRNNKPSTQDRKKEMSYVDAPPLPTEITKSKTEMEQMEEFLDDLLT